MGAEKKGQSGTGCRSQETLDAIVQKAGCYENRKTSGWSKDHECRGLEGERENAVKGRACGPQSENRCPVGWKRGTGSEWACPGPFLHLFQHVVCSHPFPYEGSKFFYQNWGVCGIEFLREWWRFLIDVEGYRTASYLTIRGGLLVIWRIQPWLRQMLWSTGPVLEFSWVQKVGRQRGLWCLIKLWGKGDGKRFWISWVSQCHGGPTECVM